jgi:hypothetical protein
MGAAWGDFDGDGDLDLAVSTTFGLKTVRVLRNRHAGSGHWAVFRLTGTVSNRDAVGARVTITTASGSQMREVTTGGGFNSQNPYELHFGLGPDEVIDVAQVRWPSGIVQEFRDLAVDRRHLIREYVQQVGVPDEGLTAPRLDLAGHPNPFTHSMRLRFTLDEPATVRLAVFDVAGRRIRDLLEGPHAPGVHEVSWDGLDDRGSFVPAGVYFARLDARDRVQVRKFIRLP